MPENYINITGEKGSVNISEEVIAVIASSALAEVDGVAGYAGGEKYEYLGKKPGSKGVRAYFADGGIVINIVMMVRYGCGIAKVASEAQKAVISAVESMTGIEPTVNVSVSGVAFAR